MNDIIDKLAEVLINMKKVYLEENELKTLETICQNFLKSDNYTFAEKELIRIVLTIY